MLPTAFDTWLDETFRVEGAFTAFLVVFEQAPGTILPIASSYVHVVGSQTRWEEIAALVAAACAIWDSVAIFAAKDSAGGPLPDVEARRRLRTLEQAVLRDRLTVKKGELFDRQGRRLDLEPATIN